MHHNKLGRFTVMESDLRRASSYLKTTEFIALCVCCGLTLFVFVTQRKIFLVLFTISHKFRVTRITGQLRRSK